MSKKKIKKQHLVPKSYLSSWANNRNQIYVFDKETQKSYLANIQDVPTEKYFYDLPELTEDQKQELYQMAIKDGQNIDIVKMILNEQYLETTLSEIESDAKVTFSKIIHKVSAYTIVDRRIKTVRVDF